MILSGHALAQDTLVEYVYNECKVSIDAFCDEVTPGEGRLLYCLAAHEDKISYDCEYALYTAAAAIQELTTAIVEELSDAVDYIGVECGPDIDEHCAHVPPGEGRILMCLDQNSKDLSKECTTALDNVFGN
jgi:hypothetical protein